MNDAFQIVLLIALGLPVAFVASHALMFGKGGAACFSFRSRHR